MPLSTKNSEGRVQVFKGAGLLHHLMEAVWEAAELNKTFESIALHSRRHSMSPVFCTLITHVLWCSFYDKSIVELPTGDHLSPEYGGLWKLESCYLAYDPGCLIALRRSAHDGKSWISGSISIPEEWWL